jgi:antitoxin HigA-1
MIPKHRSPTKPGDLIRNLLHECNLTQVQLAKKLGVHWHMINDVVRGQTRLKASLAIRLAKVFQTTPEFWMNLQTAVDIWNATQQVDLSEIKSINLQQDKGRIRK